MNKLERLIAELPRPEPNKQFDERIHELLTPIVNRPEPSNWGKRIALLGAAACLSLIGFMWGRQSVSESRITSALISELSHDLTDATDTGPKVVDFPLGDDRLNFLVERATEAEGLLGKGPVSVAISSAP